MVSVLIAVISGVLSAVMAILSTVAIEKLGGATGGVLASSPTTILPFSWGLVLEAKSNTELTQAMFTVPVGLCVTSMYLFIWRELPSADFLSRYSDRVRLFLVLCMAMTFWLIGAIIVAASLTQVPTDDILIIIIIGIVFLVLQFILGLIAVMWKYVPSPNGRNPVTYLTYALRGLAAGVAIGISVAIASVSPIAAGVASVFPAIVTTTMVALWLAQGSSVSEGAGGPMMLGNVSVSVYSMLFAVLYPLLDLPDVPMPLVITAVTCLCYLIATIFVCIPVYMLLSWRKTKMEGNRSDSKQNEELLGTNSMYGQNPNNI